MSLVAPGESSAIPIISSYDHKLRIRPEVGFDYSWSIESIYWRDFLHHHTKLFGLTCRHLKEPATPNFRFAINALFNKNDIATTDSRDRTRRHLYPRMNLVIAAPLLLENLLPYDCQYKLLDRTIKPNQVYSGYLRKGAKQPVHTVDLRSTIVFSISIPDTKYNKSEWAIIHDAQEEYRDPRLALLDSDGGKLNISLSHSEVPDTGGARKMSFYAPYLLIDKTALNLKYQAKSFLFHSKTTSGQNKVDKDGKIEVEALMFSFSTNESIRRRIQIRTDDTEWSRSLSLDAVRTINEVQLDSVNEEEETLIGMNVVEGPLQYRLTKVITFAPRFMIRNQLSEAILVKQASESPKTAMLIQIGQNMPFHRWKKEHPTQLSICLTQPKDDWSSAFDARDVGQVHIKLGRLIQTSETLVRADLVLEEATVWITLNMEQNAWPYRIDNASDTDIIMMQKHSKSKYKIRRKQTMPYSWDEPAIKDKILTIQVGTISRDINIQEIGTLPPFKYTVLQSCHYQRH